VTAFADARMTRPRPLPGVALAVLPGPGPGAVQRGEGAVLPRVVFLDCETVSLIPGTATIWELAVIERHGEPVPADSETLWHVRPDLSGADPAALKVGGYYERCTVANRAAGQVQRVPLPADEFPAEKPALSGSPQLAATLARMLAGAHVIAANPGFDTGHVAAFLRANGECESWDYHLTDIASLVRGHAAARGRSLPFPLKVTDAAVAVGIDPCGYDAHTALGDARLVRDIFDAVTGQLP
jgi:hypothetical protein